MALRRITIHRTGIRPHLFLGGDRELVLFSALLAFVLTVPSFQWASIVTGVVFWLMRDDGAVMLRRRPEKGLLGGMIELPSTPWREVPWDEAEAIPAAPMATAWNVLPGTVQHGFTHFRLEMALLAGTTAEPISGIWARPGDFKDHALPTLTKKLVKHALSV